MATEGPKGGTQSCVMKMIFGDPGLFFRIGRDRLCVLSSTRSLLLMWNRSSAIRVIILDRPYGDVDLMCFAFCTLRAVPRAVRQEVATKEGNLIF